MTSKKLNSKGQSLPKSLWRFYMRYAFSGHWLTICIWALFALAVSFDNVLFPFYQKWLVATLEIPIPDGMNWLQHILPTLALIVTLDVIVMTCSLLRWMFYQRCPRLQIKYLSFLPIIPKVKAWHGGCPDCRAK